MDSCLLLSFLKLLLEVVEIDRLLERLADLKAVDACLLLGLTQRLSLLLLTEFVAA